MPGVDDLVIVKHRYSGFAYTPLELALQAKERTTDPARGSNHARVRRGDRYRRDLAWGLRCSWRTAWQRRPTRSRSALARTSPSCSARACRSPMSRQHGRNHPPPSRRVHVTGGESGSAARRRTPRRHGGDACRRLVSALAGRGRRGAPAPARKGRQLLFRCGPLNPHPRPPERVRPPFAEHALPRPRLHAVRPPNARRAGGSHDCCRWNVGADGRRTCGRRSRRKVAARTGLSESVPRGAFFGGLLRPAGGCRAPATGLRGWCCCRR